jgi:hypothetical protein
MCVYSYAVCGYGTKYVEFMCISNLLGVLIATTTYFVCSVILATVSKYAA